MEIKTYRVPQYASTSKTLIVVDGEPLCLTQGVESGRTVSNIIAYLNGYNVTISDGRIKKKCDKILGKAV